MNEVLRQEKKYLLPFQEARHLRARLKTVAMEDSHNGPLGYRIRSLYFDSLDDRDFHDKVDGLELRRKMRLRCYDPDADYALLEMKQKTGNYQKKRSLAVSREDAQSLIEGRYEILLRYNEPFARECYGLMLRDVYRPKAVVEYRRTAFVARENRIRITLDSDITATESGFDIFSRSLLQYPVFDRYNVVLEVKYNGFLLSYIKNLLDVADRSELSVSKYCLARSAGMHYCE